MALQILLILLPGFAASAIVETLSLRSKQTDFQRVISACLYSFVVYVSFVLLTGGTLPFAVSGQGSTNAYITWSSQRIWLLAILTIGTSVLATAYINFDGHLIFRLSKLTQRTTRHSIWNDIFEQVATKDQIVQVELDGDRSVIGVLGYYSDDADDCSLFISQAAWVDESVSETEIPGSGILLTKNSGIRSISLLEKPS